MVFVCVKFVFNRKILHLYSQPLQAPEHLWQPPENPAMKELSILKKVKQDLKSNKVEVMKVIENFFEQGEMSNNEWRKKKRELINLGKFIVAKGDDVNILEVREEPDFVVKWQNQKIGLEIVEVIDEAARQKAQKNEWLINQIHKIFKENFPNTHLFFSLSFEFDITNITKKEKKHLQQEIEFRHPEFPDKSKLFKLAHPGKYTKEELSQKAIIIANKLYECYIQSHTNLNDDLVKLWRFNLHYELYISLSIGYSAGSPSDLIISNIRNKETLIEKYRLNSSTQKQYLLMVIEGSSGYSDYSFIDVNMLVELDIKFDKVFLFDFFKSEIFILK